MSQLSQNAEIEPENYAAHAYTYIFVHLQVMRNGNVDVTKSQGHNEAATFAITWAEDVATYALS